MADFVRFSIKRYLPAQLVCLTTGFLGGWLTSVYTDNILVIVQIASWCDLIGFYGYFIIRDVIRYVRESVGRHGLIKYFRIAGKTIAGLTVEFGFTEAVDTLFIRPACIYYANTLTHNLLASVVIGIIFSDVWMMGICPFFFRLRKRLVDREALSS